MTLIFLLIFLCLIFSARISKQFNYEYLEQSNTNVIKGFFLLLVFLSHISGYYKFNTSLDLHYNTIRAVMGQTVVVAFLFFSGYGVMESIQKKPHYMDGFLKRRVLKVILHFDVAVTLFLITQIILGRVISLKAYVLALTTWGGIGNSNWYVTCILCCYVFSYICYRCCRKNLLDKAFMVLLVSLSLNYMLLLSKYRPYYCYDTVLCYVLGVVFSVYKEKIIQYFNNNIKWLISFGGAMLICVLSFVYSKIFVLRVVYEITFCMLVILLMMHIKFKSTFFEYVGINLFGLYILQRIPMMYFKAINTFPNKYIYVFVCFGVTLLLNELFKRGLRILRIE